MLDQDDIWYPRHLEALVAAFKDHKGPPLGWSYSDFDDVDIDGKVIVRGYASHPKLQNPKRHLTTILGQGVINQSSATLISRALSRPSAGLTSVCRLQDDDFFLRVFRAGFDNMYVPYSTSQWRVYSSSCGASDRHDNSLRLYMKKLLESFPDVPWRGHYYARDMIAPRFVNVWIQDSDVHESIKTRESC
jgi:hypothetical protein